MSIIARLDIDDSAFEAAFARLLVSPAEADVGLAGTVSDIVAAVAQEGDAASHRSTNSSVSLVNHYLFLGPPPPKAE